MLKKNIKNNCHRRKILPSCQNLLICQEVFVESAIIKFEPLGDPSRSPTQNVSPWELSTLNYSTSFRSRLVTVEDRPFFKKERKHWLRTNFQAVPPNSFSLRTARNKRRPRNIWRWIWQQDSKFQRLRFSLSSTSCRQGEQTDNELKHLPLTLMIAKPELPLTHFLTVVISANKYPVLGLTIW